MVFKTFRICWTSVGSNIFACNSRITSKASVSWSPEFLSPDIIVLLNCFLHSSIQSKALRRPSLYKKRGKKKKQIRIFFSKFSFEKTITNSYSKKKIFCTGFLNKWRSNWN
jgi:hypothetical protein